MSGNLSYNAFHSQTRSNLHIKQAYGDYVRGFSWDWYITLTFSRKQSSASANEKLEKFLREVERSIKAPLSCVFSEENKLSGLGEPEGSIHYHLFARSSVPIAKGLCEEIWSRPNFGGDRVQGRSAEVRRYDPSVSASFYLFKELCSSTFHWGTWNLDLNGSTPPLSFATSKRQRRRLRRDAERRRSNVGICEQS